MFDQERFQWPTEKRGDMLSSDRLDDCVEATSPKVRRRRVIIPTDRCDALWRNHAPFKPYEVLLVTDVCLFGTRVDYWVTRLLSNGDTNS